MTRVNHLNRKRSRQTEFCCVVLSINTVYGVCDYRVPPCVHDSILHHVSARSTAAAVLLFPSGVFAHSVSLCCLDDVPPPEEEAQAGDFGTKGLSAPRPHVVRRRHRKLRRSATAVAEHHRHPEEATAPGGPLQDH